jgi:hypothetical protein
MPRMDEEFLATAPADLKELYLKCTAVAQPYFDRINADPLNYAQVAALHAELTEKFVAIMWEHELRQEAARS